MPFRRNVNTGCAIRINFLFAFEKKGSDPTHPDCATESHAHAPTDNGSNAYANPIADGISHIPKYSIRREYTQIQITNTVFMEVVQVS